jgi:hypothetical protein
VAPSRARAGWAPLVLIGRAIGVVTVGVLFAAMLMR